MAQPAPRPSSPLNRLLKALNSIVSTQDRLSGLDLSELESLFYADMNSRDSLVLMQLNEDSPVKKSTLNNIIWGGFNNCLSGLMRRNIVRGFNLGTAVTDEQWEEIRNGTFRNMFIGDCWIIGGITWRIVDFNYWYNSGDISSTKPHVTIVPDFKLAEAPMNDSSVQNVSAGYIGSTLYKTTLNNLVKPKVYAAFGQEHIFSHREYFDNAIDTHGRPTGGVWLDSDINLMTEAQFIGYNRGASNVGYAEGAVPYSSRPVQFAYFRLTESPTHRESVEYWLQDVGNYTGFIVISRYGGIGCKLHTISAGIRPTFSICAS